jgi:predicted ribosomally synthesized peptide with SipW-like signal peptide
LKKFGLLILIVVLALGAIGAGYAYWSSNLQINGTVETGNMVIEFGQDPVSGPDNGIANTTSVVDVDANSLYTILNVAVLNGYPSYTGTVDFTILSSGTVDGKIKSFSINGDNWDGGAFTVRDALLNPLYTVTLTAPAIGTVIGATPVNGSLSVHVAEASTEGADAPMDLMASFQVGIVVTQFNAP